MANLILGSYTLSIAMIFFLYCIQFSDYTKSCLNNEFIMNFLFASNSKIVFILKN